MLDDAKKDISELAEKNFELMLKLEKELRMFA